MDEHSWHSDLVLREISGIGNDDKSNERRVMPGFCEIAIESNAYVDNSSFSIKVCDMRDDIEVDDFVLGADDHYRHHSDWISLSSCDMKALNMDVKEDYSRNCCVGDRNVSATNLASSKSNTHNSNEPDDSTSAEDPIVRSSNALNGTGNNVETCSFDAEKKREEILRCVSEHGNTTNLWRLREFAFTPGGYVDATVRKLVWPILTQCHVDIFTTARQTSTTCTYPLSPLTTTLHHLSERDIRRLSHDVRQQLRRKLAAMKTVGLHDCVNSVESFDTSTTCGSHSTRSSYNSCSSQQVHYRTICNILVTLLGQIAEKPKTTASTTDPKFANGNTSNAKESCDKYHYYSGLVPLTEILVTNLDSPALATLILCKLAKSHLRDSLRGTEQMNTLETSVILIFLPLLRTLDVASYHEVVVYACQHFHPEGLASGLQTLCSVIAGHISTWFCSAFGFGSDSDNAKSRLVDVFLVSHPLMPFYVAVAILSLRRNKVEKCHQSKIRIGDIARSRIYQWTKEEALEVQFQKMFEFTSIEVDPLCESDKYRTCRLSDAVEELVEMSLSYIERVPPHTIIKMARSQKHKQQRPVGRIDKTVDYAQDTISRSTFFGSELSPKWCVSDDVPTVWSLSHDIPNESEKGVQVHSSLERTAIESNSQQRDYPVSRVACGLASSCSHRRMPKSGSPTEEKAECKITRISSWNSVRSETSQKSVRFLDETMLIRAKLNKHKYTTTVDSLIKGGVVLLVIILLCYFYVDIHYIVRWMETRFWWPKFVEQMLSAKHFVEESAASLRSESEELIGRIFDNSFKISGFLDEYVRRPIMLNVALPCLWTRSLDSYVSVNTETVTKNESNEFTVYKKRYVKHSMRDLVSNPTSSDKIQMTKNVIDIRGASKLPLSSKVIFRNHGTRFLSLKTKEVSSSVRNITSAKLGYSAVETRSTEVNSLSPQDQIALWTNSPLFSSNLIHSTLHSIIGAQQQFERMMKKCIGYVVFVMKFKYLSRMMAIANGCHLVRYLWIEFTGRYNLWIDSLLVVVMSFTSANLKPDGNDVCIEGKRFYNDAAMNSKNIKNCLAGDTVDQHLPAADRDIVVGAPVEAVRGKNLVLGSILRRARTVIAKASSTIKELVFSLLRAHELSKMMAISNARFLIQNILKS